jgi:hypothetical protein
MVGRFASLLLVAAVAPWLAGRVVPSLGPGVARAEPDWQQEFAEVCAKTQDAMTLADEELRALVKRCDDLKPKIERLPPPERKVYSRRLEGCRNLYQFVLDSRSTKAS